MYIKTGIPYQVRTKCLLINKQRALNSGGTDLWPTVLPVRPCVCVYIYICVCVCVRACVRAGFCDIAKSHRIVTKRSLPEEEIK